MKSGGANEVAANWVCACAGTYIMVLIKSCELRGKDGLIYEEIWRDTSEMGGRSSGLFMFL